MTLLAFAAITAIVFVAYAAVIWLAFGDPQLEPEPGTAVVTARGGIVPGRHRPVLLQIGA